MKVLNDQEMYILNHSNRSGVGIEGVRGTQQKKKRERTHGQGQQCSDCRGEGWVEVEEGMGV